MSNIGKSGIPEFYSGSIKLPEALKAQFIKETIPENLLEEMVEWIGNNLVPEDVYPDSILEEWADDNGFSREDL